jgi:pimeloyl-ACP methyl ester carboxylesterase
MNTIKVMKFLARKPREFYTSINGVKLFVRNWPGKGEPILLLHGGLSSTESWDYKLVPFFSKRNIFGFDRTAHGRSEIAEGYYHFDYQLKETVAFIENVIKEPVHVIGWSDGGIIALYLAIYHPELVKSIVPIGANYHWDCGLSQNPSDISITEKDKERWQATSPISVERLPEIIKRAFKVWQSEPNLTKADLGKISCPALIIAGDDEVFPNDHSIELATSIPNGRLAIVPGTSHSVPKEKPEILTNLIKDFYLHPEFPYTRHPIWRKKMTEEIYGVYQD